MDVLIPATMQEMPERLVIGYFEPKPEFTKSPGISVFKLPHRRQNLKTRVSVF